MLRCVIDERSLTPKAVGDLCGVSLRTVRRWADEGLLPHHRLPSGDRRFWPADVERFRQTLLKPNSPPAA
jgi:excisionase family DNA binding protein